MLLTIILTFLATTLLYAVPVLFMARRVADHLRQNTFAISLLVEYVILPVMGKPKAIEPVQIAPEPAYLPNDLPASAPPAVPTADTTTKSPEANNETQAIMMLG